MADFPDFGEMQQGIKQAHGDPQLDIIHGLPCPVGSCPGTMRKDAVDGTSAIVCTDCGQTYYTTE